MRSLAAIVFLTLLVSPALGQADGSAECDHETVPTPRCPYLGNPFYVPPGSTRPVGFQASAPGGAGRPRQTRSR